MRIVVTGGAGFLGSHLVDRVIDRGDEVIVLDNLLTGRIENLEHHLSRKEFRFIKQDVTEFISITSDVDAVVHLASPASPKDYLKYRIQTLKVGSLGTHKALGLAKEKKARFLLASTSEVYGDPAPEEHPQREDYWGRVNPIGPRGVYDEAKRFAEAMVMAYHRSHGVDTRIIRIFNTYGPRMRANDGRVVSNFIVQALKGQDLTVYGEGNQTRSFCYVSDLIEGMIRLLDLGDSGPYLDGQQDSMHLPVNVGNPDEFKVIELAKKVLALVDRGSSICHKDLPIDDPHRRKPDIDRARKLLGWQPVVNLDKGLASTVSYFDEGRDVVEEE